MAALRPHPRSGYRRLLTPLTPLILFPTADSRFKDWRGISSIPAGIKKRTSGIESLKAWHYSGYLLIEKLGLDYQKDAHGSPILPLFKMAPSGMPERGPTLPDLAPDTQRLTDGRSRLERRAAAVHLAPMEIRFNLTPCDETGGYVARWDDPAGGGISTQGENFADLETMVRDAVEGYFVDREKPTVIKLHFVRDPELALA